MKIGSRLKNLRKRQKVSMNEIADFIGVSQQAYSRYERNERQISLENLELAAKFYGISIQALLFDTDNVVNIDSLNFEELAIYLVLLYSDLDKFDKNTGDPINLDKKNKFYVDDNYNNLLFRFRTVMKALKENIKNYIV
jgi:transcriptional regulator with XRE-family HTH domain